MSFERSRAVRAIAFGLLALWAVEGFPQSLPLPSPQSTDDPLLLDKLAGQGGAKVPSEGEEKTLKRIDHLLNIVVSLFEELSRRRSGAGRFTGLSVPEHSDQGQGSLIPDPKDRQDKARDHGTDSKKILPKDYKSRGKPGNPEKRAIPELSDPKRTDLSGQNGIHSFMYSFTGGATCQATFISECTIVSAEHCLGGLANGAPTLDLQIETRQAGVTGKEGANNSPRPRIGVKVHVSPAAGDRKKTPRHDFIVMEIEGKACQAMKLPKKIVPLCNEKDLSPDQEVHVSSHRTGKLEQAVIDQEEKDKFGSPKIHHYDWKAIGKHNLAVQIVGRDGGILGGDSGGAVVAFNGTPKECVAGVLALAFGAGEVNLAQYLAFAKSDAWAHEMARKLGKGGAPSRGTSIPPLAQREQPQSPPAPERPANEGKGSFLGELPPRMKLGH